ncbi:MAG: hypothetical protein ACREQQ_02795 [Candidatus Binatia bacterium]
MSGRRTAILAAALALLAAYFAVFEGFSLERPPPDWQRGEKILACDRGRPNEIQVSGSRGSVSAKRDGARWQSESSGPYVSEAFADLVEALCGLPIIDRIEPGSDPLRLVDFGLEPPFATIEAAGPYGRYTLLIGEPTPADNLMYVKREERREIWKVGVALRSDVEKVITQATREGGRS